MLAATAALVGMTSIAALANAAGAVSRTGMASVTIGTKAGSAVLLDASSCDASHLHCAATGRPAADPPASAGPRQKHAPRHQCFPDDRRLLRRRPAAMDRSAQSRNTPIVTLRIIIAVEHNNRPKLPSASGKTSILIVAAKEGQRSTAYGPRDKYRSLGGLAAPFVRTVL
jgi:hypothetical protein